MIQTLLNTGVALEPLAYVIKYYRLLGINTSHVQNVLLRTLTFFFFLKILSFLKDAASKAWFKTNRIRGRVYKSSVSAMSSE